MSTNTIQAHSTNELKGKKLLILGASVSEVVLVRRAQSFGVYVITTDNHLNYDLAPAKKVSDEAWDISWSDIDALEKKCVQEHVDGITAGYSEIRVDCLISLCKRLDKPCFCTKEQLEITRDKARFKEECKKYGVPVVKDYISVEDVDSFPVIVKPVDRGGSLGVGIAWNKDELLGAYKTAMETSLKGSVIIEDYITKATEIDIHYAIINGDIQLLTTNDIIQAKRNVEDAKVVQSAWMYPSKYNKEILDSADSSLRAMISGMGINDGTIFFSGFADTEGRVSFFESGYRLWGEQEFGYDYIQNGINYLDLYILYAITGGTTGIPRNSDPNPNIKGIAVNLYVTGGTICEAWGFDKLNNMQDCYLCLHDSQIGKECSFDAAILYKAGLIGFANNDAEKLRRDVIEAYSQIHIVNESGIDMLYDHIDTDCVADWWKEAEH